MTSFIFRCSVLLLFISICSCKSEKQGGLNDTYNYLKITLIIRIQPDHVAGGGGSTAM